MTGHVLVHQNIWIYILVGRRTLVHMHIMNQQYSRFGRSRFQSWVQKMLNLCSKTNMVKSKCVPGFLHVSITDACNNYTISVNPSHWYCAEMASASIIKLFSSCHRTIFLALSILINTAKITFNRTFNVDGIKVFQILTNKMAYLQYYAVLMRSHLNYI